MRDIKSTIESLYRQESRRVLSTLIRLFNGHFDLAEEALQDAFEAALAQWPKEGIPDNPRAWLITTGRYRAIDRLRRRARYDETVTALIRELEQQEPIDEINDVSDDQLRLIFTCCHPSLSSEAQLALTLREVCGLTTEQIAAAFLVPVPTLAQRIVRAKNKIRDANIPYEVPEKSELPSRLDAVLHAVYLLFSEGYNASSGVSVTRSPLLAEAIRLGRLLLELLPDGEVAGLLALMLLHDARAASRATPSGDLIPLEEQDRSLWNHNQIAEGSQLVVQALCSRPVGQYGLQAAIAALHAEAPSAGQTDWREIAGLYDLLLQVTPSPIVELNRAVAIAMAGDAESGVRIITGLIEAGTLDTYHLAFAARADLYRRLGRNNPARQDYENALALVQQEPERRFLLHRLAELDPEKT